LTQTIAPRVRSLALLLLAAVGLLLSGATPASAHAALTGSDPRQGAVVDKAPVQVSLTFSEAVSLSDDSLRVLDPKGERADTGEAVNSGGTTYAVRLHSGLPDGTYTVSYQVVSADSHPVAGAFTFSIGAPSATSVTVSEQSADGGVVGRAYAVGRYLSYAGFIVLAGGSAFVLACWPRGAGVRAVQRLVVAGWLTLTASTLALLLLRGSYTTSGKLGDVVDPDLLGDVLQTRTGAALVSRLLLLAAAALFIAVLFGTYEKRDDEEKRDLTFGLALGGGVVAAGIAATWAMSEHASTGIQTGIAMPVDIVHLLAVATWLGGLTALLLSLYRAPAGIPLETAAVRRFSRTAYGCVVTLAATGVYQTWRQVGTWSAFTDTRYGQLLLVKIGLVALIVGVAYTSRRWTRRLAEQPVTEASPVSSTAESGVEASGASGAEVSGASGAEADEPVAVGSVAVAEAGEGGARNADGPGSERAAQLARQRAAMDAARRKRARDADPGRFGLRRSVLAEAGIAAVLLTVTTMLTSTEPGRTAEEAAAATSAAQSSSPSSSPSAPANGVVTLDLAFDTGGKDGKGVVRIDVTPARTGANTLHVYAERPDGQAFDVPELKIAFTLEAQDLGPLPVVPDRITTGHWTASGVQIPMAGDWEVAVTVRTSDVDQVTVSKNAKIG
jgi:copper transport protein